MLLLIEPALIDTIILLLKGLSIVFYVVSRASVTYHWTNIGMFDCRERSFKWRTICKYFAVFSPLTTIE